MSEVFPEIKLFRPIHDVAKFIGERLLPTLGEDVPYHGGAAVLDSELYDQVQTHGFIYDERVFDQQGLFNE